LGGHSGEGSVSASGFRPQDNATKTLNAALMPRKIYERKDRLVFMDSPFVDFHFGVSNPHRNAEEALTNFLCVNIKTIPEKVKKENSFLPIPSKGLLAESKTEA